MNDEVILESFGNAVRCDVNYKYSAEINAENLESKEIFDKYNTKSGKELVWPFDLLIDFGDDENLTRELERRCCQIKIYEKEAEISKEQVDFTNLFLH